MCIFKLNNKMPFIPDISDSNSFVHDQYNERPHFRYWTEQ